MSPGAGGVAAAARELTCKKYLPRRLHFGVGQALGTTEYLHFGVEASGLCWNRCRFGFLRRRFGGGSTIESRLGPCHVGLDFVENRVVPIH